MQDTNGQNLDLVPSAKDGKLDLTEIWGGYLGATYNYTKDIFSTILYSQVRAYPKDHFSGWGNLYNYAQYALGNVMWNVNPIVQVGLEYIYGRKAYMDGKKPHDNRIQAMIQVSF